MAVWTQPPRDIHVLVQEHIALRHPDKSLSMAIDSDRRVIDINMPELSDVEMEDLVNVLKAKFPGAF